MTEPTLQTAEEVEAAETAERNALMSELGKHGLTPPKRAGLERLRNMLANHLTAKAQSDEILRAQAAERAAKVKDIVACRVTKAGDQKISRGIHIPGRGDLRYSWKETFRTERSIADALEARNFVEIEDATPA